MGFCVGGVIGDCSSSTKQTVKSFTDVLNTNITNVMNSQAQNVSATQSTVNTIELDMSGSTFTKCVVKASNKIEATQEVKAIANFKSANEIVGVIKQALDKTMETSQKQVNDFLNIQFGGGGSSEQDTESHTKIMNEVKNNISQESVQNVVAMAKSLNEGKFAMKGITCDGSTFEFTNQAIVKQVVDAMSQSVMDSVAKTMADQGLTERMKTLQEIENKGLTDLVKSVGDVIKAFTGPMIVLVIGVILFVAMGGMSAIKGAAGTVSSPKKLLALLAGLTILGVVIYIVYVKVFKKEGFYYAIDCKKNPERCTI